MKRSLKYKFEKVSERNLKKYLNREEIIPKIKNAVSEIYAQMDSIVNALWICFVSKF